MLKYLGAGGVAGLAGCTGDDGDGTPTATETDAMTTTDGTGTTTQGTTQETEETPTETEQKEEIPVGGTFTYASTSTSGAPHPLFVDDTTTSARLEKLYDGPGSELGPETFYPEWFESWEMNDSYDAVEYTIRDGLTWGAGYGQLTAEDYMYLLNEIVLLSGDSDWFGFTDTQFYRIGPDNEFISYEKTGPLSIRAELPVSKPQWLHEDPLTAQVALPKELLQKYVPNQDAEGIEKDSEVVDGKLSQGESNLGPYEFKNWERGAQWQFARNDDYYLKDHADEDVFSDPYYDFRNAPYFDEYRYQVFQEGSQTLNALDTGEVDATGIDTRKVSEYRGRDDITIWESKFDNGVFWLNLNHRINGWEGLRRDPNFSGDSRMIRQAMAELYDQETIIRQINNGNAVPLNTFHPRWGPFYPPESELYLPEGSVDQARSLLEDGLSGTDYGWDARGRLNTPEGEQLELKAVRTTGNPAVEISSNFMKQQLSDVGIKLDVTAAQWQTLLVNYAINSSNNVEGVDEPDFSIGSFNGGPWNQSASAEDWSLMFGLGFSTSPYAPWSAVRSTMPEKGTFNLWGYHQNELDIQQVIADASTADNPETTQEKMTELFAFLSRDMPVVWTQSGYITVGYQDELGPFPGQPTADGYEATSFFKSPDADRLMGFQQE